jgi:hypothetical protein
MVGCTMLNSEDLRKGAFLENSNQLNGAVSGVRWIGHREVECGGPQALRKPDAVAVMERNAIFNIECGDVGA